MIKRFNEYFKESLNFPSTEREISNLCSRYEIWNYTINLNDMSIDIKFPGRSGSVYLNGLDFKKLPLKFNSVEGSFHCENNYLETLEGCPTYVGSDFDFSNNNVYDLKGCPKEIGRGIYYQRNPIEEIIKLFVEKVYATISEDDEDEDVDGGIPKAVNQIFEAWDLYEPVAKINGKWTIFEHRLKELYEDVFDMKYDGELPKFENYIVVKT